MVRHGAWAWALFLVALLATSPSASSACVDTVNGDLAVPTGSANPPPLAIQPVNHGRNAYFVFEPAAGPYELTSGTAPTQACVANQCFHYPDFNIAFFHQGSLFDSQVGNHVASGDQTGVIPGEIDYALVYMRHGPDASTADGSILAAFQLGMQC